MHADRAWKELFERWPAEVPRRGVLVTSYGEQVLFDGFMTSEAFLLINRNAPDTMGARKLIVPFENIVTVKIVDVVKAKSFAQMGFAGKIEER